MAIKRQKLDRKANLAMDGDRVIDMPPGWVFSIDCPHHGKLTFDFNQYREHGRDELAGHMRDAFWNLRFKSVGLTLKSFQSPGLCNFWRFLDDLLAANESITRLDQIDRKLLDRYLAWMEMQLIKNNKNRIEKWSIGAKKTSFSGIKSLLVNRQKFVPASVSFELSFPLNPFPNSNRLSKKREPYSVAEQKRILDALNQDLRIIHERGGEALTYMQVLAVHSLLLGMTTGRNPQSLLDLRRESLQDHPLPDRELLITHKRRGWSTHGTSISKTDKTEGLQTIRAIPATVGDHFRFLCEFTKPLLDDAEMKDRDFIFLFRVSQYQRKGQVARLRAGNIGQAVRSLASRHELKDDQGRPLVLNMARMRPTFGTELYRRTGDIRLVQQALGHANVETTARHYAEAPLESERDHAIVLDGMVSQFTKIEIDGKVLLAADGKIPLQDIKNLITGGYNTGIARCKNPFRENESVCKKFFACFKCPSMCVFEDDLWRLFSFYYRLLAERAKINSTNWIKTYGPIIRRIDTDIASQFPEDKVEAARLKAQKFPHPTWRGPLL